MSEKILSRLERIDHKEYSCGFEFADSSTFDEMARCFEERKILAKEIERLNNIINELENYILAIINTPEFDIIQKDLILMIKNKLQELKGSDKE